MSSDKKNSLYLSRDKSHLTDQVGHPLFEKSHNEIGIFYQPVGVESPAYKRICTKTAPLKVCTVWENNYECIIWDDVDVCTHWDLMSVGYADIS
ncbi:hypothetical protein GCM10023092_22720 [Rurimicrobium arvi]|uniref:Uncharacterized protein n=1 Tax=Rurimicrobium arvi TaxID=2049916 RepID=A0ABP8MVH9_9BACT